MGREEEAISLYRQGFGAFLARQQSRSGSFDVFIILYFFNSLEKASRQRFHGVRCARPVAAGGLGPSEPLKPCG